MRVQEPLTALTALATAAVSITVRNPNPEPYQAKICSGDLGDDPGLYSPGR